MTVNANVPLDTVSALDQMDAGIFITDPAGTIIFMNRFLRDQFGDGMGRNACEHFYGQRKLGERWVVQECLAVGRAERATYTDDDGRHWDYVASPLRDARGQVVGAIVRVTDVSDRARAEEEVQRRSQELMALNIAARTIGSNLDLHLVLEKLLEILGQFVDYDGANVQLVEGNELRLLAARGYPNREEVLKVVFDVRTYAHFQAMAASGQAVIVPDAQQCPEWIWQEATSYIRSWIGAPLLVEGKLIGILNVEKDQPNHYTDQDARFMTALASQAAIAIQNARLYEQARRRAAELEALRQVSLDITSRLDLDDLLKTIVERAVGLLGAERGGMYFYLPEQDVLEWRIDVVPNGVPIGSRLRRGEGLSGKILETGRPLIVDNYATWEGRASIYEGYPYSSNAIIGVPVRWGDEFLGVINVSAAPGQDTFSEQDAELLTLFANQAAVTIQNARFYKQARELAAFNQGLLNVLADGVSIEDERGFFTFVSERLCQLLGYEAKELLGQHYSSVVAPAYREKADTETAKRPQGISSRYESAYVTKDGRIIPIIVSASPLFEDGVFRGVVATMTDITERKRMEEELRRERDYVQSIMDTAQAIILMLDPQGKIVDFNRYAEELTGCRRLEVLGVDWFERFIPQRDRDAIGDVFAQVLTNIGGETNINPVLCRDGREVTIAWRNALLRDAEGRVSGILAIGIDTTAQVEMLRALEWTEREYRDLFESAPVGYHELDTNGCIRRVNRTECQMLGYTPEEMIGRPIFDFVVPEQRDEARKAVRGKIHEGVLLRPFERQYLCKDSTVREILIQDRLIRDVEGKIVGIRSTLQDITEQKQVQKALLRAVRLEALGQMAAGIAHNFNNILASIQGYADLALYDVQEKPAVLRDDLQQILAGTRDAAQAVRRLQALYRPADDTSDFEVVDANALVEEAVALTRPRWKDEPQRQGLTIQVVTDLTPVPRVSGNPGELREVLTNLIFNAADAMPTGGMITIRTRQDGESVLLAVEDTGTGTTPEQQRRIFEPFFTTKGLGGSGLGLTVSQSIIQRHRGEIQFQSQLGKGTCFTIRLPAVEPAKEVAAPERGVELPQGRRILIVDDEDMVRRVLERILVRSGQKVTAVSGGREAIETLRKDDFDMVITDLGMPGVSGFDVAHYVKEHRPALPVILVTGWGATVTPEQMQDAGAVGMIAKPFRHEQLVAVLGEHLR